ncbi:DUF7525 family protein [Halocatena marina]|uniref:Uncharacterized protein n=1 Tax=Halocatena marina TaxID=2934937 RepID=A0ABD5YUM3_9EURY|nr:hypothetical protein [Halocatena marina]
MTDSMNTGTDMQVGLAMLFGAISLVATLAMLGTGITHQQVLSGWGFAGSVLAGSILIAVIHLYG